MNEMIGIKLTDGMYDEGNIQYLKAYAPEKKLKTNMPHILHQADMATTRIEYEDWIRENTKEEIKVQGRVDNIKKAVTMEETSEQLSKKSKDPLGPGEIYFTYIVGLLLLDSDAVIQLIIFATTPEL
jgi:hypothetical protein